MAGVHRAGRRRDRRRRSRIELFGWKATSLDDDAADQRAQPLLGVPRVRSAIVHARSGIWMARSPVEARGDRDARPADGRRDARRPDAAACASRCSCSVRRSARSPARCTCTAAGSPSRSEFSVELGLGIFVMLIVGGIDSLWGPILGAAFYVWVPHLPAAGSTSTCSATRSASTTRSSTARCCCS